MALLSSGSGRGYMSIDTSFQTCILGQIEVYHQFCQRPNKTLLPYAVFSIYTEKGNSSASLVNYSKSGGLAARMLLQHSFWALQMCQHQLAPSVLLPVNVVIERAVSPLKSFSNFGRPHGLFKNSEHMGICVHFQICPIPKFGNMAIYKSHSLHWQYFI